MEQVTRGIVVEGVFEENTLNEKDLLSLFHERDLKQEEVELATRSVKEEVLRTLGYNPLCSSYVYPRSNQVDECNNPNFGDGKLRRYILNLNKIIWSLGKLNGIGEPPTKFTK